ncbi:hypothetical protein BHM03_00032934 [Ensete ventricosum]|uniref:Uncharacterized protein n=1 Tax=Ensete ventricosum TaxID=4639 RepID=A0A445MIW7_ENSVE|nr:hypothetical protein BHM03_00032934 [Ensete ventricosum]
MNHPYEITTGPMVVEGCDSGTIGLMVAEGCNSGTIGLMVAEGCSSGMTGLMVAEGCNSGTIGLMVAEGCSSGTTELMVAEGCNSGTTGLMVAEGCSLGMIGLMVVERCNSSMTGLMVSEGRNSGTTGLMVTEGYNSGTSGLRVIEGMHQEHTPVDYACPARVNFNLHGLRACRFVLRAIACCAHDFDGGRQRSFRADVDLIFIDIVGSLGSVLSLPRACEPPFGDFITPSPMARDLTCSSKLPLLSSRPFTVPLLLPPLISFDQVRCPPRVRLASGSFPLPIQKEHDKRVPKLASQGHHVRGYLSRQMLGREGILSAIASPRGTCFGLLCPSSGPTNPSPPR